MRKSSRTPSAKKRSSAEKNNFHPDDLQKAFEVAKLIVEERLSQEDIAAEWHGSRSKVQRWWDIAKRAGIYEERVVPPIGRNVLDNLRKEMMERLELKDVVLVDGREEMLSEEFRPTTKEAIFHSAARAAAEYLDKKLARGDTLCLAWGRAIHAVIQSLHPTKRLPDLTILPLLGVLSVQPDWFEANALVQAMAEAYHSREYYCLPIPAIVREKDEKRVAVKLPLVKDVLAKMKEATFAVTSLAQPDARRSALVHRRRHRRILEPGEIEGVLERGAVGEICAWWFNKHGEPVTDESIEPIGLGLDGLQRIVKNRGTVMAVVAADSHRIEPLHAAIKGRMVNVVVTDHVTGEELLRGAESEL